MNYTGGADYMDDYWDYRDATLAGRPGFRPDLAPSGVINALTNYVPRMRDLLHSTLRINRTLTVAVETTAMSCPAAGKLSRSNEP